MPPSQPLAALLTPQNSVFAQSFGSRIQGWIVNYSRSACAQQPQALSAPPLTRCWLISIAIGLEFVFSHVFAASNPPLLSVPTASEQPMERRPEGVTWPGSFAGASHWVKWSCHRSLALLGRKALGGKLCEISLVWGLSSMNSWVANSWTQTFSHSVTNTHTF